MLEPLPETIKWLKDFLAEELRRYKIHEEIETLERNIYEAMWQYSDPNDGSPLGKHIIITFTIAANGAPMLDFSANSPFGEKLAEAAQKSNDER